MRTFLLCSLLITLIATATGYGLWAEDRPAAHYLSDLRIKLVANEGVPGDQGNLLAVEPQLVIGDFQSSQRLHLKLAAYLTEARNQGLLNAKTVVVLPEHIGSWLILNGEKDELYQATSAPEAMNWLMASNPLLFARALVHSKGPDRLHDARARMKAKSMATHYQQLFGGLAKEFGVTLVAGSIVLPEPYLKDGVLRTGAGSLYNVSLVFGADGRPLAEPQRQQFTPFSPRGAVIPEFKLIDTPAGRLAVLIGSDSWYPINYRTLEAKGVELIAIPASILGQDNWRQPWGGLQSKSQRNEIKLREGEVNEGDAWHRLTLEGQAASSHLRGTASVFLRSTLWNAGSNGQSFMIHQGQLNDPAPRHGARMLNLWL